MGEVETRICGETEATETMGACPGIRTKNQKAYKATRGRRQSPGRET